MYLMTPAAIVLLDPGIRRDDGRENRLCVFAGLNDESYYYRHSGLGLQARDPESRSKKCFFDENYLRLWRLN